MSQYLNQIEKVIHELFSSEASGHDVNHLKRTLNIALHIQEKEGGDKIVIGAASLLHDIHRLTERETGEFCPPKDSLPKIRKILQEVNFPKEKIDNVLHCIEFHEEYNFSSTGKTVNDLETLILQDADNIDGIGAIGVGRTFSFGGAHKLPMWIPENSQARYGAVRSSRRPALRARFSITSPAAGACWCWWR